MGWLQQSLKNKLTFETLSRKKFRGDIDEDKLIESTFQRPLFQVDCELAQDFAFQFLVFRELDAVIASRMEPHEPANQGLSRTMTTEIVGDEFAFIPCGVNLLKLELKIALCGRRRFLGSKSAI